VQIAPTRGGVWGGPRGCFLAAFPLQCKEAGSNPGLPGHKWKSLHVYVEFKICGKIEDIISLLAKILQAFFNHYFHAISSPGLG
jgi:hypothetical protein